MRDLFRTRSGLLNKRTWFLRALWLLQACLTAQAASMGNKKDDSRFEAKILFMRSSQRPSKTKTVTRVEDYNARSGNHEKEEVNNQERDKEKSDNQEREKPLASKRRKVASTPTPTPIDGDDAADALLEVNLLDKEVEHDALASMMKTSGNDSSASRKKSSSSSASPYEEQRYSSANAFALSSNAQEEKNELKDQCPKEAVRCNAKKGLCDHHENCREWARKGECEDHVEYMSQDCRLSCLEYYLEDDEVLPQDQSPLRCDSQDPDLCDYDEWCEKWARKGECDTFRGLMERDCSLSCKEIVELCDFWAEKGECEKNEKYMLDVCSDACNKVKAVSPSSFNNSAGAPSSASSTSGEGELEYYRCNDTQTKCDHDKYCGKWAARGDCVHNREFMLGTCAFSCNQRIA